jgi:hypothetical protein
MFLSSFDDAAGPRTRFRYAVFATLYFARYHAARGDASSQGRASLPAAPFAAIDAKSATATLGAHVDTHSARVASSSATPASRAKSI